MSKKIRTLIVKSNEKPFEELIDNTLKGFYHIIDCELIEVLHLGNGACIVCDEEGKFNKEGNRKVGNDIIAGTFVIVGDNGFGDFISLTDEQVEFYSKRFAKVESYTQEDLQNCLYIKFEPLDLKGCDNGDANLKAFFQWMHEHLKQYE